MTVPPSRPVGPTCMVSTASRNVSASQPTLRVSLAQSSFPSVGCPRLLAATCKTCPLRRKVRNCTGCQLQVYRPHFQLAPSSLCISRARPAALLSEGKVKISPILHPFRRVKAQFWREYRVKEIKVALPNVVYVFELGLKRTFHFYVLWTHLSMGKPTTMGSGNRGGS